MYGEGLRNLRKQRRLTLVTLSERTDIDVATLSRMENNVMEGTLTSYISIAKVFGLKMSEVFQEIEKKHRFDQRHTSSYNKQMLLSVA